MRGLKALATLGLLIALTGWAIAPTERICTVGFAAEEFKTLKGAVIARVEIADPSKPEYDSTRYNPNSAYLCDSILVGPGVYSSKQFPNDPSYNPNIEIRDRGKTLIIKPLREGDVSSRQLVGKVDEAGKPVGQAISIIGSKNPITIEGLSVTQGITGILIQDSENVTISDVAVYDNQETGISIQKSINVTLEGVKVYNKDKQNKEPQQYGIRMGEGAKVIIKDLEKQPTEVYANRLDGVFVAGEATASLANAKVYGNNGCGVKTQGASVTDPSRLPSNVIFDNKGGNTCPRELARKIRRPEVFVPEHVKTLQKAIEEAEFVQTEGDPIYQVVINPESDSYTFEESVCIDRSIIIRSTLGIITLRPAKKEGATIAIASPNCPLREKNENGTNITIQGSLEGSITLDGLRDDKGKVDIGVQVGTLHQNPSLKVVLKNVTIQNYETGVQIEPTDKHTLVVEVAGFSILADADCTKEFSPKGPPLTTLAHIQHNSVGISANVPKQANVELQVSNTVISHNNSGLVLVTEGGLQNLTVDSSWITNNTDTGLKMESKAGQPKVTISKTRIWGNQKGGLQLKADSLSKLTVEATNTNIRENGGFGGVYIEGPVTATMKADTPTKISPNQDPKDPGPHSCGINDNFGSGVRVYGPTTGEASVTIDNLHILGNGYRDKTKNNYIARAKEDQWAGPDGIFAHGSVKLTVQNSHIGSADGVNGNAGIGIALSQPTKAEREEQRLDAKIIDNLIEHNGEWGVAHVVKICENIPGVPSNFYGKNAEGYGNIIKYNRWRVQQDLGPQVCPPTLENLMQPKKP